MEENPKKKKGHASTIIILFLLIVIVCLCVYMFYTKNSNNESAEMITNTQQEEKIQVQEEAKKYSPYTIKNNSLNYFDLAFLKFENENKNKIYSPLSIKYTLEMLSEGATGNTKAQIDDVIGEYKGKVYNNTSNISLANSLFVRDTYKGKIKENYINNLKTKYGAEVQFDSFASSNNINKWISNKTFNLVNNMLDNTTVSNPNFNYALVNALAIDMDWEDKFLAHQETEPNYKHEKFYFSSPRYLVSGNFENNSNKISGMQIMTSINNYDVVKDIGESKMREDVGNEYQKFLNECKAKNFPTTDYPNKENYLNTYIEDINKNYKNVTTNTDYSFYVDNNTKVFGKDLKEYDNINLEYIAIMPTNEDLTTYIQNVDAETINKLISSMKDLKSENFEEGKITVIDGYIPKFKFDYQINLMDDLKKMGITDAFDETKASLDGISDDGAYIGNASHKANIEFTQDGIKAAAATTIGGLGGGTFFDYNYDVPVEKIDLTFNKPYMFLIRDKDSGEIWFAGTVYEPLQLNKEAQQDLIAEKAEFHINDLNTVYTDMY